MRTYARVRLWDAPAGTARAVPWLPRRTLRPGYRGRACVAWSSWRSASRRLRLRSAFFSDGSFCGLQSRQPARRCLGRLRLWWAMTSSYQQTPLRRHGGASGSNNDTQPCRNAGERRVFEPRFWRDRQSCVGASGGVGRARGAVGVEPTGREAGWSQGQRCPATGHHESKVAASSSGLGVGCRCSGARRSRRADEAHGDPCSNGATARSVGVHRVRQLVPAHGCSRTGPTIYPSRQGPICAGGTPALRCPAAATVSA
jgi:hypothetical protein